MPFSHFPEPTAEQLAWMHKARPILKDGSVQQSMVCFILTICVDSRPNKRVIQGQAGDHLAEQLWHPDFLAEVKEVFSYTDESGQRVVNLKALNMWRYDWLRPYTNAMAGGRFSQDFYSTYYTIEQHNVPLAAMYLTQHDQCAAAQGHPRGTRLDWDLSIQATVHDMWRTGVGSDGRTVPIYTANIKTSSTQLEDVRLVYNFNLKAYSDLVPLCDPFEVLIPSDDCKSAQKVELPAWTAATRSCVMVEDSQDLMMIEHRRWRRQQND